MHNILMGQDSRLGNAGSSVSSAATGRLRQLLLRPTIMSGAIPDLPPELVDLIIKHAADDSDSTPTLKACSLVGQAFQASSQQALFSGVQIDETLDDFMAALDAFPHLYAYVISLEITRSGFDHPQLPALLARLKHVRSLTLDGARWPDWDALITPELLSAFHAHIFPSIMHLHLRKFSRVRFSVLPLPKLQSLTLTSLTCHHVDPFPTAFPLHNLSSLQLIKYKLEDITGSLCRVPFLHHSTPSLMPFLQHSTQGLASLRLQPQLQVWHTSFFMVQALDPLTSRDQHLLEVLHVGPLRGMSLP